MERLIKAPSVSELAIDGRGRVRLALSRVDAAAALGMSIKSFQRHVQPEIPCVYLGAMRLYRVVDLQAWLDAQSRGWVQLMRDRARSRKSLRALFDGNPHWVYGFDQEVG